jgi:CDP-diacylglycerol--serine O-phosphatidyltransferase
MFNLPNLLTLGNLCSGFLGILWALEGNKTAAVYAVLGSLVLDFLDGAVARAMGISSALGKELDSLADMVSFGVLPGVLWYGMLEPEWVYLAWLTPAFSALRLAKFNLDDRQSQFFIGLPTPAHTLWVCSLLWVQPSDWVSVFAAIFGPLLMITPIRLMALKVDKWNWAVHWPKPIFLLFCVGMVALSGLSSAPYCLFLYLFFSYLEQKG